MVEREKCFYSALEQMKFIFRLFLLQSNDVYRDYWLQYFYLYNKIIVYDPIKLEQNPFEQ